MFTTFILSGGLGTRLGSITEDVPKCLIPVNGKPFIHWQLEYLQEQGIKSVIICVGHLSEAVYEELKDKKNYDMKISFSNDGNDLLGTGGAIRKALENFYVKNLFVLYGDSLLNIDMNDVSKAFISTDKPALMTIIKNSNDWDKNNINFYRNKILEYNKFKHSSDMKYIDYGLSVLSSSLLYQFPLGKKFELSKLLNKISLSGDLQGYEVHQRFYEIGSLKGLRETENYLRRRN